MAVRRRPSYGFDIAGSSLGLRPEEGVSRSTLAQLFPEIEFGATATTKDTEAEEVEKPEETAPTTPVGTGVTALADEDKIPGSELEKYKISGELSYAAPFNIQVGPTGPQGRGSLLGYSGGTGVEQPKTPEIPSVAAPALPTTPVQQEQPKIDLSPYENALAESQNLISSLTSKLDELMSGAYGQQQMEHEPEAPPAPAAGPAPTPTPTTTAAQRIVQQAEAFGKPTSLAAAGTQQLISSGQATGTQIARQAAQGNINLTKQAEKAVVQNVVQTSGPKISASEIRAVVNSGARPQQIVRQAEKAGVQISRQAQKLIDKAQANRRK